MLDFFRRRTVTEYLKQAKETYNLPEPTKVSDMPKPKTKEPQEHYRIGARPDGMTTITMLDHNGFSMTLTLNQSGCEQLIRMIRATYAEVTNEQ